MVLVLVFKRPAPVEQPVDEPAEQPAVTEQPAITEQIVTIENITVVIEQPEIEEQEKPMTDIPVEEEKDEKAVVLAFEIANQSLMDENKELREELKNLVKSVNLLRKELGLLDYILPDIPSSPILDDVIDYLDGIDDVVDGKIEVRLFMIGLQIHQQAILEEKQELQDEKDFLLESIATMEQELEI